MKNVFKSEITRCFNNYGFFIAIIFSMILVIWYSLVKIPYAIEMNYSLLNGNEGFYETSFTNWLFTRNMYTQSQIFYLMFPFLATIPFGTSFFVDRNSGYIKNVYIRTNKFDYLISKYLSVFISGGISAIFPMLFSFCIVSAFLPSVNPESSYLFTNVVTADKWSELFFSNPTIYILIYIVLTFVICGLLACTALPITFFSYKSFLPLVFPFFFYLISSLLCELAGFEDYSMRKILETGAAGNMFSIIFIIFIIFLITFVPYILLGMREDTL